MDSQDHKTTLTSTGHEVHLCHRCGWPFPNPHPSARHRRAHKRVCGTIEGYTITNSEDHDRHSLLSDDEHDPDEDEHTPSPILVKKNAEDSGRVGEKSNKSEDDYYSDAVTNFLDSGISPSLEERFERVREVDESVELKGVEGDQTADRTEQSNDPKKSEEIANPRPLVYETNLSVGIIPTTDIQVQDDNMASVTLGSEEGKISDYTLTAGERQEELCEVVKHDLPPPIETVQIAKNWVHSAKRTTSNETVEVVLGPHGKEHDSVGSRELSQSTEEVALEKESDPVGLKEVSQSTEEIGPKKGDDSLGLKEVSQSTEYIKPKKEDDSVGLKEVSQSSGEITHEKENGSGRLKEVSQSTEEIRAENEDESVGLKDASHSTEEIRPVEIVGEDTLPQQTLNASELHHVPLMVATIDQEVNPKTSLDENVGSFSASEGEKCDMNGKEKRNLESKESFYFDTISTFDSTDITLAPEDNQIGALKKDVDHCEEKADNKHLETVNEKNGGASVEENVIPDSTLVSDMATEFQSSCGVESDARKSGELSKNELRDYASFEAPVSSEISKMETNIHVTENVDRVEPVGVVESMSESKENNEVGASKKASEPSIPKYSTSLPTHSELFKNSANDKGSETIETTEETAKLDREVNLASSAGISQSKFSDVASSKDLSPSESVGIVSNADLDGNFLVSEIHLVTLSSKEAVPPPSDPETCVAGDDKTVINVEDVGSKTLQAEVDDKLDKENDGVPAINLSGSSSDRADSMDANCGSVVSDTLEPNPQKAKTTTEEARPDKSDTFEPPSFMTLVQSGGEEDGVKAGTEIETVQNNQQPKSNALQAGWFPTLTNVVNESDGRKKNEEIIAKVTNWSPVKQPHGPLKTLLNEVKSPHTKQAEGEAKDDSGGGGAADVGPTVKDQDTNNKDVEEWNSPARYPIEIKKEKKKKGRSMWVPFVCCSSVHRDL